MHFFGAEGAAAEEASFLQGAEVGPSEVLQGHLASGAVFEAVEEVALCCLLLRSEAAGMDRPSTQM